MTWGLYSKNGEALPPRTFSSGKTQEETIDEIIERFDDNKIVLLKGGVGSGKSIIGATVAGALGKGIINVPVKPLQEQYKRDYEGRLYLKLGERRLKIGVLKGRANFTCKSANGNYVKCSSKMLPCTIPLNRENPRWKIASRCKFWSPIYPHEIKYLKREDNCKILDYESITGKQYFHKRREGCGYFDQNQLYLNSDVIIYNNAKWYVDSIMGKKIKADVEIFDEADLFLDGLTLRSVISTRMISVLLSEARAMKKEMYKENEHAKGMEIESSANKIKKDFEYFITHREPSKPYELDEDAERFLKDLIHFLKILETEFAEKVLGTLEDLLLYRDITSFYVENDRATFFVPEPGRVMNDLLGKSSDKILFMSATVQESSVLSEVYGLDDLAYVEGETKMPGTLYKKRTDDEKVVNWKSWQDANFKDQYWKTLSKIMKWAEKPTLVQVHSYNYLPDTNGYDLVPTKGDVRDSNQEERIHSFKKGEEEILFSTKTDRGIDLPDGVCRAIVILKYPYPSMSDPLFEVMKKRLGDKAFWNYYNDIARRDLYQQVGRGLRNDDDWIEVWSPDLKVHQELMKIL